MILLDYAISFKPYSVQIRYDLVHSYRQKEQSVVVIGACLVTEVTLHWRYYRFKLLRKFINVKGNHLQRLIHIFEIVNT